MSVVRPLVDRARDINAASINSSFEGARSTDATRDRPIGELVGCGVTRLGRTALYEFGEGKMIGLNHSTARINRGGGSPRYSILGSSVLHRFSFAHQEGCLGNSSPVFPDQPGCRVRL